MFTVEETIRGFIAGISGRALNELRLESSLVTELDFQHDEFKLLLTMITAEYSLWIPYGDLLSWCTVRDVVCYVESHMPVSCEQSAGIGMVPEVQP